MEIEFFDWNEQKATVCFMLHGTENVDFDKQNKFIKKETTAFRNCRGKEEIFFC